MYIFLAESHLSPSSARLDEPRSPQKYGCAATWASNGLNADSAAAPSGVYRGQKARQLGIGKIEFQIHISPTPRDLDQKGRWYSAVSDWFCLTCHIRREEILRYRRARILRMIHFTLTRAWSGPAKKYRPFAEARV